MADILEGKKGSKPAGLRAPASYATIEGPKPRLNNAYGVVKQKSLSVSGRKNT